MAFSWRLQDYFFFYSFSNCLEVLLAFLAGFQVRNENDPKFSALLPLLLDSQIGSCLKLPLPWRDPGDAGKGLSKDLCDSRTGDRSVHPANNSDKCCACVNEEDEEAFTERERKAQFKHV